MDGTTVEQERRAKPYAGCSEPSQAKEKGKRPKTREQQYKKRATSVTKTVDRTSSRRKSLRDRTRNRNLENPVTQEIQGTGPREYQPHEMPSTPAVIRSSTRPTRGQLAVQLGCDHAKHAREWVPIGDQGARKGNGAFSPLTH